jgi:hypothetical protein
MVTSTLSPLSTTSSLDTSRSGTIGGIFELGFVSILVSFGFFLRMFMPILTQNNFIIPFIIIVASLALGTVLIFTLFPLHQAHLRKVTLWINFAVVGITYLFLFNMPEYKGNFTSYQFENWDPFSIGGTIISLI